MLDLDRHGVRTAVRQPLNHVADPEVRSGRGGASCDQANHVDLIEWSERALRMAAGLPVAVESA